MLNRRTGINLFRFSSSSSFCSASVFLRPTQLLLGSRPGTVSKWDDQKLFGFITDDETGDQFFCHKKDLRVDGGGRSRATISLKPEEKVGFDLAENPIRGPGAKKCVNVTHADGTPFGRGTTTGKPATVVTNRRRVNGFVSYLKIGSSYGFLTADDDKESRIFFHAKDVKNGPLYHRDRVIFDILADEEREGTAKAVMVEKTTKK